MKALHEEADVAVNKIKVTKMKKASSKQYETDKKKGECKRCGYFHEPKKCPAYGKICNLCKLKNHFSRMCRSQKQQFKPRKTEKKVHEIEQEEDDVMFMGCIEIRPSEQTDAKFQLDTVSTENNNSKKWTQKLKLNNSVLTVKLDTGAECNVLSVRDFERITNKDAVLQKSGCKLVTYSGHMIATKGKAKLKCDFRDKEYELEFQIIERDSPAILGRESCTKLGLIRRVYSVDKKDNTDILSKYEDVFTGLGCVPGLHHIQLNPDVTPVIHPPRKVPIALKDRIKAELDRMEDLGVIVKQTEPTDWVNSMVTVVKPNKLRIASIPKISIKL